MKILKRDSEPRVVQVEDELKEVSIDRNQHRVEEPNLTVVTGCASILLAPAKTYNVG